MQSAGPHARAPTRAVRRGFAARAGNAVVFLMPLCALLAVALVWQFTDLHTFDAARFAEIARSLRESPAGLAYTLLAFAIGTLLFFPITPLVLGTTLAFDPLRGFLFATLGTLLAASVTYGAGRLLGSAAVERLGGPRLARVSRELHANAFRASIAMRMLPVGHFTVLNLLAGSLRIPFRSFFLGNVAGIVPGVLFVTLFAERFARALRSPDAPNIALAAGCLVLLVVLLLVAWRIQKRRARRLEAESDRDA
jgi:phospholipase D1/2